MLKYLLLLLLILAACSKEEEVKIQGTDTLSTELIFKGQTYSYYGFYFEKGEVKLYDPAGSSSKPDFTAGVNDQVGNRIVSFNSENFSNSFALLASYSDADSALAFFNDYRKVDINSYEGIAQPVLENQVWLFRTRENKYGKMLTLDTLTYHKNSHLIAEIKFKWVYQPDGSGTFNR